MSKLPKKDFFGNELAIGDTVAFCRPQYRDLVSGTVIQFTAQQVRVEYKLHYGSHTSTYLNFPSNFIKHIKKETNES